jgi:hypothetical protein
MYPGCFRASRAVQASFSGAPADTKRYKSRAGQPIASPSSGFPLLVPRPFRCDSLQTGQPFERLTG